MAVTTERVDRLEEALTKFMEQTSLILAATREDITEIRASNARTDRQLLEMQKQAEKDRQQAEKDRQQAEKDRQQAEKDRQQAEKDRQQAEKERKEFNRQLAALSDRLGTLIEDMVAPNAPRVARTLFKGDEVIASAIRVKRQHPSEPGRNIEIDLIVVGHRHLLICEAKSKVTVEKAAAFQDKIRSIPEFFPEFSSFKVLPLIASVTIEPTLVTHLSRLRIYALGFGEDTMEILNSDAF
ncbi:MAG: cell envelope integrity protein TolA [Verrucomicrobia bacterium]|nr:cell envelope integrity protein TolA [Verrucomicrobiota bacterium]